MTAFRIWLKSIELKPLNVMGDPTSAPGLAEDDTATMTESENRASRLSVQNRESGAVGRVGQGGRRATPNLPHPPDSPYPPYSPSDLPEQREDRRARLV